MFRGKDRCICSSGMLCWRDSLSAQHTLVCMLHMGLQSTPECIDKLLRYPFFDILHLNHMVMDCKDLYSQLDDVGLNEKYK